ncbi:hypothetical protein J6590_062104 [Homalodisca vitripennis]|nr:hypothetical protein J6590_062104 [Homalodisca vitripennis]
MVVSVRNGSQHGKAQRSRRVFLSAIPSDRHSWEGTARPQDYQDDFSSSSLEPLLDNWEDTRLFYRLRHRSFSEGTAVLKGDCDIHDKRDIA